MKRLWWRLSLFAGIVWRIFEGVRISAKDAWYIAKLLHPKPSTKKPKQANDFPSVSYIQPGDGGGKVPEW